MYMNMYMGRRDVICTSLGRPVPTGKGHQTIINGWKVAGVIKAVADARNGHVDDLNPFV